MSFPTVKNPTVKICLNPECKDSKSERWRKGWRLRNHDFADLCDRCGSIYEEGRFCETFHKFASGWRCCERCGKQVHCGCIVSSHAFVMLDVGGIECSECSRKNSILTPNPIWPPRSLPGWLTESPIRNLNQTVESGSLLSWKHATNLFNKSATSSDMESRTSFEVNKSNGFERIVCSDRLAAFPSEKNQNKNLSFSNGSLEHNASEMLEYGKAVFNCQEEPGSCMKDRQSTLHFGMDLSSTFASQPNNQTRVSGLQSQQLSPQDIVGMQSIASSHTAVDTSRPTHIRNDNGVDMRVRKELLPRYWPKISDEELQQISGGSNSVITPLFEKMLSASDAGRIGRLVLPKKCAETYFPPISHPEGLPLRVQDIKGKEWTFQFRFWPNNNSRMYVLEGITNCMQSLQLQAGDVVTFSRTEPEGKLIMGFRKASTGPQSDQGTQAVRSGNKMPTSGDVGKQKPKLNENFTDNHFAGSEGLSLMDQSKMVDLASGLSKSKTVQSGYVMKEATVASLSVPSKRKNGILSSKNKCTRVKNVDLLELKVTLEEAQGLFRSPANHVPHVVIIEDFGFEEYEDAPIIGRPTVFAKDSLGEDIQWAQCDGCLKWRKLPSDALLPARWTCSMNLWNLERSSCDAAEELSVEKLNDLLSTNNLASSKKRHASEMDTNAPEAFAGFTTQVESEAGPASAQPTTKHPRHRPGCSCIVCVQPPSGKGPKHHPSCTCNVCMMIKRRFRTMTMRRERNQLEREAAARDHIMPDDVKSPEMSEPRSDLLGSSSVGCVDVDEKVMSTPMKGQIDLNSQPEREEEASTTCCVSSAMVRTTEDATERRAYNSCGDMNPNVNQGCGEENRNSS